MTYLNAGKISVTIMLKSQKAINLDDTKRLCFPHNSLCQGVQNYYFYFFMPVAPTYDDAVMLSER